MAEHLHALLTGLLLFEQLALTGDIAAVALGEHVLAQGANVLAGDDARTDCGLNWNLELLTRNQATQLLGHHHAVAVGLVAVHDGAECVHLLTLDENVHLDQVGGLLAILMIIKGGVAFGTGLQLIEEIEHDFSQRNAVMHFHALGGNVLHRAHNAAMVLAQIHHRANEFLRRDDVGGNHRLDDLLDLAVRELARVSHVVFATILGGHVVGDVRSGLDKVEAEFA